ncbi:putative O-methyltransferase YrrM [Ochrobactrum sp. 19YEA23]|nr:putative O-methyltransferase YrrM [Ochrobactrum sp. 19YEA23]
MNAPVSTSAAAESAAAIATAHASRYLQQLAKHFAHKLPVTFDPEAGQISFSIGECRLRADDQFLHLALTSPDQPSLAQLQDVVERHLVRFAFREELAIQWRKLTVGEHMLDKKVQAVLDEYHARQREERDAPRIEAPGGRDGGQDMRMRAIGPDTGRFLNTLARSLHKPTILEIGTSFGYSGIWLGEAVHATGGKLITMELHGYKSDFAKEMATKAGLADHIDFRIGDAVAMIEALPEKVDLVFLDLWKDLYVPCLEAFYPKLNNGAIVVADNMIRPGGENLQRYGEAIRAKPAIGSVLLPIGTGLEVSRFEA